MCKIRKKPVKEEIQERIVKNVWKRGNLTYTQYETPTGEYAGTEITASNVEFRRATPPTLSIYRDSFGIPFGTFESEPE
jgi:hypothetical protein